MKTKKMVRARGLPVAAAVARGAACADAGGRRRAAYHGNAMPKEVGDIGFTIIAHPRESDTAWVFPMDGTSVWPRTSPDGRPAVYRTRDAGKSWERQDKGFPKKQGWFTVKRQAFCGDMTKPAGLYLGTTGGEVWASTNEGGRFTQIAAHLPEIYSVVAVERL